MFFEPSELNLLAAAMRQLNESFTHLPTKVRSTPPNAPESASASALADVLFQVAEKLGDNDPYFHPLYCGQMLKPPHRIARLAYALAMLINPNNHALDGGRASASMERLAVAEIARMFDWSDPFLGHLTGGGTLANFEALWVARELAPGRAVAASAQSHYTHGRLSSVLQIPFNAVPVDAAARLDVAVLTEMLHEQDVGTVVVTLGTTALGAVDPLAEIVDLRERFAFRIHVDAAYGGYFALADNLDAATRRHYSALSHADSIAIDPHKQGLQPYGCGCILFRDPAVARYYLHDSPYTYYTSDELHLGEISLECSRAGAAAVALWSTMQLLPLTPGGEFANGLSAGRTAALRLYNWLVQHPLCVPLMAPELDIVCWTIRAASASESSSRARQIFESARRDDVYLALATVPRELVEPVHAIHDWDQPGVTCLRSTLMKPEHADWLPEIIHRLERLPEFHQE